MANLATMIMEGTVFSKNDSSIDISNYDFSKQANMESEFANNAVVALYSDIMEADKAYMAADVIMTAKGLHAKSVNESFEIKPVIEGAIRDFFSKIVDALKKFWAKIVEWFKKVFEWFRMMFSNAKEFAKRYGKELRNKKYDGFKHEGFEWTLKKGDEKVTEWVGKFETAAHKTADTAAEVPAAAANAENAKPTDTGKTFGPVTKKQAKNIKDQDSGQGFVDTFKGRVIDQSLPLFEGYDDAAFKDEMMKKLDSKYEDGDSVSDFTDKKIKEITGADDQADMRSNLEEIYRNGDSEKSTITEFGSGEYNTPSKILDFLDKGEKLISDLEKHRKSIEKPLDKFIKAVDKIKIEDSTPKADLVRSNISYMSSYFTSLLNCIKTCFDVQIAAYRGALSELLGAMKRFYSFKSATESMDMYDVESLGVLETVSVIEGKDDSEEDKESKKDDDSEEDKESKKDDDSEEEASESVKHILEMAHSFSF